MVTSTHTTRSVHIRGNQSVRATTASGPSAGRSHEIHAAPNHTMKPICLIAHRLRCAAGKHVGRGRRIPPAVARIEQLRLERRVLVKRIAQRFDRVLHKVLHAADTDTDKNERGPMQSNRTCKSARRLRVSSFSCFMLACAAAAANCASSVRSSSAIRRCIVSFSSSSLRLSARMPMPVSECLPWTRHE